MRGKISALFCSGVLLLAPELSAQETTSAPPKVGAVAIPEVLQGLTGKIVELRLKSGEKIGGTVTAVGSSTVHISQLTGAEFYDAVVVVDSIAAVVVRTKAR
jgi:hypothetical protein